MEQTLLYWLNKYGVGAEQRLIKQALTDLHETFPNIELVNKKTKAKLLLKFLYPKESYHADEPEATPPKELQLPKNIKGYCDRMFLLKELIGTGWGNCISLSLLYTILSRELGIICNIYFVNTKNHMVCYVTIDGEHILVDPTEGIFGEEMESRRRDDFAYHEEAYGYKKNCFLVEDKYVAIWSLAIVFSNDRNNSHNLRKSISLYSKFLKKYPQSNEGWNNKGFSLYLLGKVRDAIKCYNKALKIDKNNQHTLNNKEKALKKLQ